ncbi:DNA-binding transcriptional LysR family regulator [Actinoalloteichus hoggarensis]|uniref:HTH-type transcriptional regulator BenM n=1 Tax=Actinoalloteichus hoggarensis TaxID=1470176 RepID=A0A221W4G3_9PSEU|nr:LysR family transcriptional regulator [Actinoalloteichus hoggarensis]ASO20745.1 HTH-type transcriptional regulator BenM [Actinoalloteichus hoggarensis]MBB5920675.1 DNA-binding transcriptional LysR family regulator [Actinoalloteichus hoggarensis]
MEARQLRYAVALAEHQHFGRAAAAVGIAQPPLSKQIAALEREMGARLFDRTTHGVFPTAAGEAFLVRAHRALAEMSAAAVDSGRAARGETGMLRIGFVASALLEPLPRVLVRFGRDRPDVRLSLHEMSTSRSTAALVSGELDIAIGLGSPRGPGVESLAWAPLGQDRLVAAVARSHPYAGQQTIGLGQLRRQHLIISAGEDEPAVIGTLRALFGADTGALEGATVARDVHTIAGLAACGVGVGLGPARMRMIARPDLWFCSVTPHTLLPDLTLSFRAAEGSPVLAAFLDTLRGHCADIDDALARQLGPG